VMKLVWNPWTGFILLFTSTYAAVFLSHGGYALLDPLFWTCVGYLLYRTMWSWLGLPAFMLAAYHIAVSMKMNILGTVTGTALLFIGLLLILGRRPAVVEKMWKKIVANSELQVSPNSRLSTVFAILRHELMQKLKGLSTSPKFGDLHLDLSKMMIPEGEQKIDVSRWLGSVIIYVPYDLEVNMMCSARIGTVDLFGERKKYRGQFITSDYHDAERKVLLRLTTGIGDVTVRWL